MEEDVAVLGYGGRMQTFAGNSMVSGRFLNGREFAGDEKKCVISDKLAAMADLQIRDRIRIHREEFEIIGIMHGYGKNKVVVPYDCFVQSLEESGREGKVFLKNMILSRAGVGMAVSAFSLLNIFVILLGMMEQRKEEYAVKRAVGAKKSDLLREFLKETVSAMSLAILLFLVSFQAIVRIFALDQEVIFDLSVLLGVTGIAFLFCVCLSALLVNHFMRSSIYELLQKERG